MTDDTQTENAPAPLPLDSWHRGHGSRMVSFAGYSMPIRYEGIIAEHEWTRSHAGLFDVSHMGQVVIAGDGATEALERLIPADLAQLKPGRMRYSLLLADDGGIMDDLIVTNAAPDGTETYQLVVNGAMKQADIAHIAAHLSDGVSLTHLDTDALLALQGPKAAAVLDDLLPGVADAIGFMQATSREWSGGELRIARSGYTGEDGFEIGMAADLAERFADALIADRRVRPIGLGARDSLRLEAGLPLYGHDLDLATDPVSADLAFAISKRRRAEGGFPGAEHILRLLAEGPETIRVGLDIEGRAPAREGSQVVVAGVDGEAIGRVTSGGFSPTLGRPIAMAYVRRDIVSSGTGIAVEVRGRQLPAAIAAMPFVPHNYRRAGGK